MGIFLKAKCASGRGDTDLSNQTLNSTEVESMSYTDFSVGERKSGDASKIHA